MFILRKCSDFTAQENQVLGDYYQLITEKDYKTFEQIHLLHEHEFESDNVYAFILADGEVIPLYEDHDNYIVNESGKTFANISKSKVINNE